MAKETFIRVGDTFTFEYNNEKYLGCVHQILGSVTEATGYYFRIEKLQTFKKKKYDFLFFGFGPWKEYQRYVLLEDSYFEGLTTYESRFYELGTWIGNVFLLVPSKLSVFAKQKVVSYYSELEMKKADERRLKNIQLTRAL